MTPKQIATFLRGCAEHLSEDHDENARVSYLVPGTGLRITCRPTRQALLAVADKYDAGFSRSVSHKKYYGQACGVAGTKPTVIPKPGQGPAGVIR